MLEYLKDNAWVWAGTALVLLTLSGSTLRFALIISCTAAIVHMVFSMMSRDDG